MRIADSFDVGCVAVVDGALRVAATRQLFTRTEVLETAPTSRRIIAEVDADSADRLMISRIDLLDPLLDIRAAVCA